MTHLSNNTVRILLLGALLGCAAIGPPDDTLRVGSVSLQRCGPAWCSTLARPLDPSGLVPGTLPVYFELYPHAASGAAAGTLVGAVGGPGYPSTQSRQEFLTLFAPLRDRYDVLLMDYRGTGRSAAIDCRALQHAPELTRADIGACGRSLGRRAPFYSTKLAADDLAAVLGSLGIDRIGLYGESYGSYFAQVFARRHAPMVRALVLDGAYPLDGPDYAWYPNYAPAMRDKFNIACQRASACRELPGTSIEHIAPALARLRAAPLPAQVRVGAGRALRFTADASRLAIVMFGGYPAYATVRELDAAARAFAGKDTLPLLRLMAEVGLDTDSREGARSAMDYSAGLAAAVSCQDPPQIFDMRLPPGQRGIGQLLAARRLAAPDSYAPFTIDEFRGMPLDYAYLDQCAEWPAVAGAPLIATEPPYPAMPVLVISGELDDATSVADGALAAARYPHGHQVVIANSFHASGFHLNSPPRARSECAAILVRRFLDTLSSGDEGCARAVPPVRLVPRFARQARELTAAAAAAGNGASAGQLRVVTAVLLTCEDVLVRAEEDGTGAGVGLRGGAFSVAAVGSGFQVELHDVRWTEDVSASGTIDWPGRSGLVHASITLQGPQGPGELQLSWPEGVPEARASVHGTLGGEAVAADAPAP